MIPGEYQIQDGEIELNAGRRTLRLSVANSGDLPIQVGSHYHFFETNDALAFDRALTRGMRLNIPAGTAVRFEPGQSREVELVELAGARRVFGFAGRVMGDLKHPPSPAGGCGLGCGGRNARAPHPPWHLLPQAGEGKINHPTEPSRLTSSSFLASTANSIGSSRNTDLQKPSTIIDTASSSPMPRERQ